MRARRECPAAANAEKGRFELERRGAQRSRWAVGGGDGGYFETGRRLGGPVLSSLGAGRGGASIPRVGQPRSAFGGLCSAFACAFERVVVRKLPMVVAKITARESFVTTVREGSSKFDGIF